MTYGGKFVKILICDRLLKGKPHSDWKEGWELYYAFNRLGIKCDIAGMDCPIPENEIPKIADNYDFIMVTENCHEGDGGWQWWKWENIKTPKMFWAIETHYKDFVKWLTDSKFDYVGLNNKSDIPKYGNFKSFYYPYGVSKRYAEKIGEGKKYGITFIGGITEERKTYLKRFGIQQMSAFGKDYIKCMQESKICFNKSVSYDLNAKNLEVLATGTFLLTNYNEYLDEITKDNPLVQNIFYNDDNELKRKIEYYLKNDEERETMAKQIQEYILNNHSYENRAELLIKEIG